MSPRHLLTHPRHLLAPGMHQQYATQICSCIDGKRHGGPSHSKKKCKKNKLPPPTVVAEGKGEGTSKKFWAAQQKLSNRKIIHGAFGKDHSKCVPNSSRFKHLIELLVGLSFSAFLFFPWWYGSMQMSTDRHKQMTMDWPWVTKGNTMVSIDRRSLHCFAKLVATHVQMCWKKHVQNTMNAESTETKAKMWRIPALCQMAHCLGWYAPAPTYHLLGRKELDKASFFW